MAPVTELTVGQVAMRSGVAVTALADLASRGLIRSRLHDCSRQRVVRMMERQGGSHR